MASIMDILKIKPFVEVTVGQLLWGYEDPLLKLAKDVVPKEQKLPYEEFGLMYNVNLNRYFELLTILIFFRCSEKRHLQRQRHDVHWRYRYNEIRSDRQIQRKIKTSPLPHRRM